MLYVIFYRSFATAVGVRARRAAKNIAIFDETLDINIYSSKESIGAPIYDADGYLVAVTCFWNEKENEYEAVSAQKCREIFAKMADK